MLESQASKGKRRREQLLNVLKRQGRITIQEVIERFGISEATARRDLELMEREEPVIRTIGGAMYDGMNTVKELPFAEKEGLLFLEKERIALAAAALIEEGDVVALSGGTTNYLLAKLLKIRRGITVVTNAVNVAMELAGSDIQVVVTGGLMRHNSFELCGPLGEGMIGQLNIGKMFLGVDGVSTSGGITTYSEQEAHIAKAMMGRSQATYAMFDHTKVGRASLFSIAPLAALQAFITDEPLPQQLAASAQDHGIRIYIAEPANDK
ncbi:DeoR/GlpR family DNA-binding transcription regulator [Paenibacillus oenotherae]|uniref:DeoR/GlpR family DNA-binding transcription regulator n=1 Tax=Paenibacillus oenotherae TaxID=1435645 RepID=A0ABS7DAY3_9BACL|nr:DeoR/GlpR family DNA-binding transcription regulator [Paenibacillus oenotherae]MBW7477015.1 DeoR/GlpR family DNA-binding transcription regulator [Paenibacillus oenotherae]